MAWASQGHLGTLRDLDSRFHGNVLAAIICDPQVYEQVECKHKDLIFKSYKGSKLFRVMAKGRALGTDHLHLNHCARVLPSVEVCGNTSVGC